MLKLVRPSLSLKKLALQVRNQGRLDEARKQRGRRIYDDFFRKDKGSLYVAENCITFRSDTNRLVSFNAQENIAACSCPDAQNGYTCKHQIALAGIVITLAS